MLFYPKKGIGQNLKTKLLRRFGIFFKRSLLKFNKIQFKRF